MSLTVVWGAVLLGLFYGLMVLGVFLTFRLLNYADLSVDGSFPLGAAVTSSLIVSGANPFLATAAAPVAGALAGITTGVLHTKFNITPLLSGILTSIGLYSINLRIMGRPNIPLLRQPSIFDLFTNMGFSAKTSQTMAAVLVILLMILILYLFLNTELGKALCGTGDNEIMMRSLGVNTDLIKIMGLAISNALVSLSGAMIAQYQGFADISMGIGIIIIGLASVILGEVVLGAMLAPCAGVAPSIPPGHMVALRLKYEHTDLRLHRHPRPWPYRPTIAKKLRPTTTNTSKQPGPLGPGREKKV